MRKREMDTPIISPWRVARAKQSGVRSAGKNKPIRKDGGEERYFGIVCASRDG